MKTIDARAELWNERSLTELVRYLKAQHHRFVREELSSIALRLADFCTSSASADPDLMALRAAFTRLSEVTLPHLHHEEEDVFPAVEALEKQWETNQPLHAGSLSASIRLLSWEHEAIAAELLKMHQLRLQLLQANPLSVRCASTLNDLATLESNLNEYMLLEDSVLFPRAEAIEEQAVALATT